MRTSRDDLAHHLAAGFLEVASRYAAQHGQDALRTAMEQALANLSADYGPAEDPGAEERPERKAVLLACELVRITLAVDARIVN